MADPSIIIDAEPDWADTPEVSYGFSTVIQDTPYFKEQRRPLHTSVIRGLRCTFTLETENAQRVLNRLISGVPQVCCVPIYSEPLFANTITQGASLLTIQTDLTYLWNAQNSSYFILLDYTTGASEMLKVASVSGQNVTLSAPISGAWVAAQTVLYPAMVSMVKDVKANNVTSRVASFDAQFDEITIGEAASKVWVGLEEQECPGASESYLDVGLWTPLYGTWDGSKWNAEGDYGSQLFLWPQGDWAYHVKPTKLKMTIHFNAIPPTYSGPFSFRITMWDTYGFYDLCLEHLVYPTVPGNYTYELSTSYGAGADGISSLILEDWNSRKNYGDSSYFSLTRLEPIF